MAVKIAKMSAVLDDDLKAIRKHSSPLSVISAYLVSGKAPDGSIIATYGGRPRNKEQLRSGLTERRKKDGISSQD